MGDSDANARTRRFVETTIDEPSERLRGRVSGRRLRVEVDPDVARTFNAQVITFALMNLLIRLGAFFPRTELVITPAPRHAQLRLLTDHAFADALGAFLAPFPAAQRVTIASEPSDRAVTLTVVVGPSPRDGCLQVWAEGWTAYLNTAPIRRLDDENPIGPCVAAVFGTAEIFKELIAGAPMRPGVKVVRIPSLIFNAYDYELIESENPPLPHPVDLGSMVLVGAGGIASAFTFAAAALPTLTADLPIVDDDEFDDTNQNRHLVARPGETGLKATRCADALSFAPGVRAEPRRIEDFYASLAGSGPELVAVAIDADGVRRYIQGRLPRVIVNAATGEFADMRVSRHDYTSGACLSCISVAGLDSGDPTLDALARRLGVPVATLLPYHERGARVPRAVLTGSTLLPAADIERFADRTTQEIWQLIYNEAPVQVDEAAPSISFLSALPGFLLLGEVIKERSSRTRPPLNATANVLSLSVLGRPHPDLLRQLRPKRTSCDCVKDAWQKAHARAWVDHAR